MGRTRFIPVNGHNLTNIFSTLSVAPAEHYPKRGFGAYFMQHAHSLRFAKETRDG